MSGEKVKVLDRSWLIKSSTKILGPFSLAEITEGLRTKQISIIDEIRQPHSRWVYIRENPMFMDIVRSIRDEPDAHSEETMTQSILHNTMTKTDTVSDDLTPGPGGRDVTPLPFMKDITPRGASSFRKGSKATSYGANTDSRLLQRMEKRSNLIRWSIIAAALGFAVLLFILVLQKDKKKGAGYSELMAQAIRYKNLGLYDASLQSYAKATRLRDPDNESKVQMAMLLISEDRQTLLGRRILEKQISSEGKSRSEIVDSYLGIAVSYMIDGDLRQAEETLQRAIGHEPYNVSTLLNLAIIQYRKGQYTDARSRFNEIYLKNPQSSIALFGKAISSIENFRKNRRTEGLANIIDDITKYTNRSGYLRQELLMLQIFAQGALADVDGLNKTVVKFLNQLSGESRNYVRPPQVDWRFTQWDHLENICAELYMKHTANPEMKALRGTCLMEVNRDVEAAKMLQEAMAEAPKDPYILATQANYLTRTGRNSEAIALLKMAELTNLSIKNVILGKICIETKDVACAKSAYSRLSSQDRSSVIAAQGLSWVAMKNKKRSEAYSFLNAGLQIESNYIPLIELRDQLESE